MEFILYCIDRQTAAKSRQQHRAAHLEFISTRQHLFRYGGPLQGPDGSTQGSLMVLNLPDRAAVEQYMNEDPYFKCDMFESVTVWPSRQVVPETAAGLLAIELGKQREADAAA